MQKVYTLSLYCNDSRKIEYCEEELNQYYFEVKNNILYIKRLDADDNTSVIYAHPLANIKTFNFCPYEDKPEHPDRYLTNKEENEATNAMNNLKKDRTHFSAVMTLLVIGMFLLWYQMHRG